MKNINEMTPTSLYTNHDYTVSTCNTVDKKDETKMKFKITKPLDIQYIYIYIYIYTHTNTLSYLGLSDVKRNLPIRAFLLKGHIPGSQNGLAR